MLNAQAVARAALELKKSGFVPDVMLGHNGWGEIWYLKDVFPSFMRSLPAILDARPKARVLVVGGDEVSYGARLPEGQTWRQRLVDELGDALDLSRVHFLGKVPYQTFLKVLQVSRAHVYLTYPFVLSWSMLEAMAAGCLVVGSRTEPVEEVIRDGENGILVDFFRPKEVAAKVIAALSEPRAFDALRTTARRTIVERYDLRRVCLPGQLRLLEEARQRRYDQPHWMAAKDFVV